jgi:hypothetical protein
MQGDAITKDGHTTTGFFDWPSGFLGYNSWSNWFLGITIADQLKQERDRLKSFYEACCNPTCQIPNDIVDYGKLNIFWRGWAQVAIIKPLQVKLIFAAVLAFFGSPAWAVILYGRNAPREMKERQYEETFYRIKDRHKGTR